ncbi:hypothetical protein AVEN_59746-1 [Araneus ventricosus]|uniref:Uncharacterized protein n=1 Tax=Araneus ventricosus TaxID=182803 RepID=A0A4Y2BQL0_ARAVE|nr:hypothetical protein AVEN_59746-1 [Araneus ventricosus]
MVRKLLWNNRFPVIIDLEMCFGKRTKFRAQLSGNDVDPVTLGLRVSLDVSSEPTEVFRLRLSNTKKSVSLDSEKPKVRIKSCVQDALLPPLVSASYCLTAQLCTLTFVSC